MGKEVSELCRLCLKESGNHALFENPDLIQDIYLCTGVKIIQSNNLPRKICHLCLKVVLNAKELRLMVQENERHMKILFDYDNPVTQDDEITELNHVKADSIVTRDTRSSLEDKDTDEKQNDINSKRDRSRSPKKEPVSQIFIRKDLFTTPQDHLDKDSSYIEGAKYGITKTSTLDDTNDVKVTYTCSMCPKSFSSWRKVYCHQRMHNKNLICPKDTCEKKFATKGDLEKHIRTHTGERPYQCDICERSFTQRVTLKSHKETVHQ